MGWFSSDEVVTTGDTTGNIANHMVLKTDAATRVEVLLLIIAIIKLVELFYIVYSGYVRRLKKRFVNNSNGAQRQEFPGVPI